jgi:phage recombination protein Bet
MNQPTTTTPVVQAARAKQSALEKFGEFTGVSGGRVYDVLKETIFKNGTDAQLQAFIGVCNEYKLNPFLRQIWAFPAKGGGIVPIVSVDGWIKIINDNTVYDGEEFEYGPDLPADHKFAGAPSYIQCTMYRKDRSRPTRIREYFVECYRPTDPWNQSGARMLRHRALIQCARVAFGLGGIFDPDEGDRIIDGEMVDVTHASNVADLNKRIGSSAPAKDAEFPAKGAPAQIDNDTGEILDQPLPAKAETVASDTHGEPASLQEKAAQTDAAVQTPSQEFDLEAVIARIDAATTLEQAAAAARLAERLPDQDHRTIVGNAYADKKKRLSNTAKAGK